VLREGGICTLDETAYGALYVEISLRLTMVAYHSILGLFSASRVKLPPPGGGCGAVYPFCWPGGVLASESGDYAGGMYHIFRKREGTHQGSSHLEKLFFWGGGGNWVGLLGMGLFCIT